MAKDDKAKAKGGEEAAAPSGNKKKLVLALVAVLVLGGGAGGFFFWKSRQASHAPEKVEKPVETKLQFYTMDPPFVANFEGMQNYRFLQIHVRLATRSPETLELLTANDPILRNDLLLLFSAQSAEVLATKEGKDKLRADSLELVRKAVKSVGGDPKTVESVLFTSFVMQ